MLLKRRVRVCSYRAMASLKGRVYSMPTVTNGNTNSKTVETHLARCFISTLNHGSSIFFSLILLVDNDEWAMILIFLNRSEQAHQLPHSQLAFSLAVITHGSCNQSFFTLLQALYALVDGILLYHHQSKNQSWRKPEG